MLENPDELMANESIQRIIAQGAGDSELEIKEGQAEEATDGGGKTGAGGDVKRKDAKSAASAAGRSNYESVKRGEPPRCASLRLLLSLCLGGRR